MPRRRLSIVAIILVNLLVLAAFGAGAVSLSDRGERRVREALGGPASSRRLAISHREPLTIGPLYDDPSVVTDEELKEVLERVRPAFNFERLQPNYVEHALRAWGSEIQFGEPGIMDGPVMVDFLTDYARHLASWGPEAQPLLVERPTGLEINWGRQPGESIHHDHWLACLTEAGVPL